MPFVTCPECETEQYVSSSLAGSVVECRTCPATFQVGLFRELSEPDTENAVPSRPPIAYVPDSVSSSSGRDMDAFLGTASLIVDSLAFLTLLLPCFWFLALPLCGLGAALGFVGIATSRNSGRVPRLSIAGAIWGTLLLIVTLVLVLIAQQKILEAIDRFKHF